MQARPFLKWAGGKSQLLAQFSGLFPPGLAERIDTYVEPFLGGGACFFLLASRYSFRRVILNDINREIVMAYEVVKIHVESLIETLSAMQADYYALDSDARKQYYYSVRDQFNMAKAQVDNSSPPSEKVELVSKLLFLNRTCFNGLYRLNSKGQFNVPMGSYKSPMIVDPSNMRAASHCLRNAILKSVDFAEVLDKDLAPERTFVYLDPPYRPLSASSSFTSYSADGFGDDEQRRLALWYRSLDERGFLLMLSNSDSPDGFFDSLYSGFRLDRVSASRAINSKAELRGAVKEIVVRNYACGMTDLFDGDSSVE